MLQAYNESVFVNLVFENNQADIGGGYSFEGIQPLIENIQSTNNVARKGEQFGADKSSGCTYGEYENTLKFCEQCGPGKYNIILNATECLPCPEFATCPGREIISVDPGYWRIDNRSDIIDECLNLKENCLGGTGWNSSEFCFEGHIGALCEECDLTAEYFDEAWSNSAPWTCGRCSEVEGNTAKVILINIFVLVNMFLSVRGTIKQAQMLMMKNAVHLMGGVGEKVKVGPDLSGIYMKVFTNYLQIIGALATFNLAFDIPGMAESEQVGMPAKSMAFSMDCFLVQLAKNEFNDFVPYIYFRTLWQIFMAICQLSAFLLIISIAKAAKATEMNLQALVATSLIYLFIYLQPSFVQACMRLLSCRLIAQEYYITDNVSYICDQESPDSSYMYHSRSVVLPILLSIILLFPGIMFFGLRSYARQKKLKYFKCEYAYGFLYQEPKLKKLLKLNDVSHERLKELKMKFTTHAWKYLKYCKIVEYPNYNDFLSNYMNKIQLEPSHNSSNRVESEHEIPEIQLNNSQEIDKVKQTKLSSINIPESQIRSQSKNINLNEEKKPKKEEIEIQLNKSNNQSPEAQQDKQSSENNGKQSLGENILSANQVSSEQQLMEIRKSDDVNIEIESDYDFGDDYSNINSKPIATKPTQRLNTNLGKPIDNENN